MTPTITLTLTDGVHIVVPDSLNLITPYVLQEQLDWFEDEIKFLRRLLQPGSKVIDIGANYGVYTLSMAKTVGPSGCVWAFEPASSTATLLAKGIAANAFTQIVLEQSALSSSSGTAQLSLNQHSELNALVHGQPSSNASETVPLVTLDQCMVRYGWGDIEFMKIDAEGEEANILKGGKRFFAERSPLVQYEIKAGVDLHLELVQDFAALGYASYRLVPGLDLLIPFDAHSAADGYLLNLFCCKQDCAARLAARGYLLESTVHTPSTQTERVENISTKAKNGTGYNWRHTIAKMPYGMHLAPLWEQTMAAGKSAEVEEALSLYFLSRDRTIPAAERFSALDSSFRLLNILCERQASYLRLASLARVARDYGARALAVSALRHLANLAQKTSLDLREPFLAPANDSMLPPGAAIGNWALAAILEELERLETFSSFYVGLPARQRLEVIRNMGFASAEMARRLRLLQQRFGLPKS